MPEFRFESRRRARPAKIPSILQTILDDKALRLEATRGKLPQSELKRFCRDLPPPRAFRNALDTRQSASKSGTPADSCANNTDSPIAIIAEFKRRSPSRGVIRTHFDLEQIHRAYERGGADAYSILTEEDHFGGSLEDLKALHKMARLPLLRKDFLFDPYQIYEGRAAGADALLLIAAALEDNRLRDLIALTRELDMEALVEIHCAAELARALECGAGIVGINNRDLHSFRVDITISLELAPGLPGNVTGVSESGISAAEDIRRLQSAGIHAFLVGEHLMRAADPGLELLRLKEAAQKGVV
jgi:indole-3-glycerol phosphate synthase